MSDPTHLALRPRMSPPILVHLLVWMFFTVINLAAQRSYHHLLAEARVEDWKLLTVQVTAVLFSMFSGGAMTGLLMLATQFARRHPSVLRHPGHWIVAIIAIGSLLDIVRLLHIAVIGRSSASFHVAWFVPPILISVVQGILLLLAITRWVKPLRWRNLFVGTAVLLFFQAALHIAFSFEVNVSRMFQAAIFLELTIAVGFVVVSLWEWTRWGRRDWIHWLGVTVYAAQMFVVALQEIAFTFL